MDISSDFAILDVKKGRTELAEYFKDKTNSPLAVTIEAKLNCQSSKDDGVSIEFSMTVQRVTFK